MSDLPSDSRIKAGYAVVNHMINESGKTYDGQSIPLTCMVCKVNEARYIKDARAYCTVCWQMHVTGERRPIVRWESPVTQLCGDPPRQPEVGVSFQVHAVATIIGRDGKVKRVL